MSNRIITKFPSEIVTELKNYVYRLIDPRNGSTFYVGRGKGDRIFQHIKGTLKDKYEDDSDLKMKKILEIKNSGLEVIHIIHRHGLGENVARHVEAALIDAYPGVSNIISGYKSNDFGPMHVIEIMRRYEAEEADFQKHKVLLIKINRSISESNIYNATRYAWRLSVNRAKRADFILAIDKGVIVGVFIAETWLPATKENFPEYSNHPENRYGFIGREADKTIVDLYFHKRIANKYTGRGISNPILYNYK